jgi:hypothetical protein
MLVILVLPSPVSEGANPREDVSTDNLERAQSLNILHPADCRLETHVGEFAKLVQQHLSPRTFLTRVHFEEYRLLDSVVVTALLTTVTA